MGCVEELPYEVVLSRASFAECRAYVEKHCPRYCHVDPGFTALREAHHRRPADRDRGRRRRRLFPYTKPCYGTFLLRIEDAAEAARLAPRLKRR